VVVGWEQATRIQLLTLASEAILYFPRFQLDENHQRRAAMALRSPFRSFARLLHTHPPRLQGQPNGQNGAGELKTFIESTIKDTYSTGGGTRSDNCANTAID
jgi:hypothetical protein